MTIPMFDDNDFSVLLVEHNRHLASILRHILSVGGIREVHHSLDAISALEVLKSCSVNMALLDADLPGITAMELATLIRTAPDSPNPKLPLVLLSGRPTKSHIDEAMKSGISYYVRKPLSADILLTRVKWALENPGSAAARSGAAA